VTKQLSRVTSVALIYASIRGDFEMDINDIQIGGTHYKREYQHWDLCIDIELPFVLGCAAKYISRWKDKNGAQDLRKSLHYLAKAQDSNIRVNNYSAIQRECIDKFADQHGAQEADIIRMICYGNYSDSSLHIGNMIAELESAAMEDEDEI